MSPHRAIRPDLRARLCPELRPGLRAALCRRSAGLCAGFAADLRCRSPGLCGRPASDLCPRSARLRAPAAANLCRGAARGCRRAGRFQRRRIPASHLRRPDHQRSGSARLSVSGATAATAAASRSAPVQQASYKPANPPDESNYPIDPQFMRQIVAYNGGEKPGTIIVDTPDKFLFLVEDGGKAMRYGIGVGRPGFTWSGVKTITAMKKWPDWTPPPEMIARQPGIPHFMPGGIGNPLGSRARFISARRFIASTAPMSPGPSATMCPPAASACAMRTSKTFITASMSAPRS